MPWPDPVGGYKIRHYDLTAIASPDPSPLKMRVFRSTNLMINVFERWTKRRDESKLSPHSHEDFEQISLGMQGGFEHHLRYPWGSNKAGWQADEHERYDQSPSVLVIPPRVIHTSQDVGEGTTWLIDVFGPPRMDFSSKPGFVLNADRLSDAGSELSFRHRRTLASSKEPIRDANQHIGPDCREADRCLARRRHRPACA